MARSNQVRNMFNPSGRVRVLRDIIIPQYIPNPPKPEVKTEEVSESTNEELKEIWEESKPKNFEVEEVKEETPTPKKPRARNKSSK